MGELLQRLYDGERLGQEEYQSLVTFSHLMKPRERDQTLKYFFEQEQFDAVSPAKIYRYYKSLLSQGRFYHEYADYVGWLMKCQSCFKRNWTELSPD